jgi:hypothetical protein
MNYQEFLKTNDYYIQRIKLLMEKLTKQQKISDIGLILEEQIYSLALVIVSPPEDKNLREALLRYLKF